MEFDDDGSVYNAPDQTRASFEVVNMLQKKACFFLGGGEGRLNKRI